MAECISERENARMYVRYWEGARMYLWMRKKMPQCMLDIQRMPECIGEREREYARMYVKYSENARMYL